MEEEKCSPRFIPYFIQIPLDVLFDDNIIPLAKQLYWCIKLLDDKASGCFASNGYLAAIFNVTERSISRAIACLKENGYIYMENFDGRKRILRHIEHHDRLDNAREAMIQRIEVFEKNRISEYEKACMTQRSVETRRNGQCRPDALDDHINNSLLEEKSIDNSTSLVNTNVLTKEKQTACAVRGRDSSETPCSASAGIGWRSKSKDKTSLPEPHDNPDSLRKTESSSPENISSPALDNISVLTPIIDDSEHFQNSDVSDIIPEEKMDSSPIKPALSTVSGDDNIPPVQIKNRDNFKIRNSYNGAESKEIIDHWNGTGLKFLDSKYKSYVTNYLTDIMNGTFFDDKPWLKSPSNAFEKHEIMAAIDNRAMAAIDVNYSPIDPARKKTLRDLPMWLWLYNPSTRKSQFLNNLKPPKPSYRQPNLIEDEQPSFTAAVKAAYVQKILYGVEPISSWSNHDENNFRRAGALLWEFVERHGKRIPSVYRHQYYRLAEALLDAILNDVKEDDRPSITTGWLCSDLTFNRRLPSYMGNIRMLL